jgi:hypothetical protein
MPRDFCVAAVRPEPRAATAKVAHRVAAPSLRRSYRLAVGCPAAESDAVQALLKSLFDKHGLPLDSLRRDQAGLMFARITALLACSVSERAALVWIVYELGTNPSIRRLQWETVPKL